MTFSESLSIFKNNEIYFILVFLHLGEILLAILYPELKAIEQLKVKPTEGELYLLQYLQNHLDDSYEVFFQPFLNGDRPDIIVIRKSYGVMIFEVKDWELEYYYIDHNGKWLLKNHPGVVPSPFQQVKHYRENLFNWHIEGLLEKKILDNKYNELISKGVYFHNSSSTFLERFLVNERNRIYTWVISKDTIKNATQILNQPFTAFDDELYEKVKNCLKPSFHDLESGKEPFYNRKQRDLIKSSPSKQKIKGVAGSGKTIVLAKRAVNAHKRTKGKILILTFNITLRNYIHDRISDVREKFAWSNFQILHYHLFIRNQCNTHGIGLSIQSYQDLKLFDTVADRLEKFDAIFIDEIQDFKYEWQQIIRKYFLAENGELVLLGDEKQNIYNRELDKDKKIKTTIPGNWNQLNSTYRLSSRITKIAMNFQNYFFKDKYEIDVIELEESQGVNQQLELELIEPNQQIHYYYLDRPIENYQENFTELFQIIDSLNVHRNDLCFLAPHIELLREMDYFIRNVRKEKTTRAFESKEVFDKLRYDHDGKFHLEKLRKERKYNFWMNAGTTKLSTIHSFKGWEINNLVLFFEQNQTYDESREPLALKELIYTGITRCRKNLFIINIANQEMDAFFRSIKDQFDRGNF
jgi:hypothetical protein